MNSEHNTTRSPQAETERTTDRQHPLRLPSARGTAMLAALMLAVGIAVGAAIGPAPESSFAGESLAGRLPQLLAALVGRQEARAAAAAATTTPAIPAAQEGGAQSAARHMRHRKRRPAASPAASSALPATSAEPSESKEEASMTPTGSGGGKTANKLPAVTSVWLIELAGANFTRALGTPGAAPYIDGQLIPGGTLLSGWSAVTGSAFASEAALAAPAVTGEVPPLLHSIVQPPCPEGTAGAQCAPETPGQLTAADEFLKTTLAQITTTSAYREHGLVVVTFATVGIAAQAGLPAGASSAMLTSQPPGGVVLLSPFARAGARPSTAYDPTSPRQSLEALLH